jgi:hypothetical protein
MPSEKDNLQGTNQTPGRKVSLTKLKGKAEAPKQSGVIGWEYAAPVAGQPYRILLYEGMVLRTSLVKEIRKTSSSVIIRTLNSVYQITYSEEERSMG